MKRIELEPAAYYTVIGYGIICGVIGFLVGALL